MTVCNNCGRNISSFKNVKCFCSDSNLIAIQIDKELIPEKIIDLKCLKCHINPASSNGFCSECKIKEDGPKVWYNLHTYKYISEKEAILFFNNWVLTIPSHGCSCKENWNKIVSEFPPNFSSAENFFKWSVDIHNLVNQKLGKAIMSLEEAKKVYNIV